MLGINKLICYSVAEYQHSFGSKQWLHVKSQWPKQTHNQLNTFVCNGTCFTRIQLTDITFCNLMCEQFVRNLPSGETDTSLKLVLVAKVSRILRCRNPHCTRFESLVYSVGPLRHAYRAATIATRRKIRRIPFQPTITNICQPAAHQLGRHENHQPTIDFS